jgi:hypothetical protein
VGYTENGFELVTTPVVKEITPVELIAPALQIITGAKVGTKFVLMEPSQKTCGVRWACPRSGIKTIGLGSGGALNELVIACQGHARSGHGGLAHQCSQRSDRQFKAQGITKLACTFLALSDSSKAPGYDVFIVEDYSPAANSQLSF